MPSDYSGLTRNLWPGTFSPTANHPIVLDTELRGSLRTVSGTVGDRLTDITGQRLEEGMLVYLKAGYTSGAVVRVGGTYYKYSLQLGESRNATTGAMPNAEANWSLNSLSGSITVSKTTQSNVNSGTVTNVSTLRFDEDSGLDVVDLGNGEVRIQLNSTFKTWKVSGQSDLVANGLDTVEFVAGPGITINTDPFGSPDKQLIFGTVDKHVILWQDGELKPKTGTVRWHAPDIIYVNKVIARLSTAADQNILVRYLKNGTQIDTITIPSGVLKAEKVANATLITDDYLTVDVVNVGTPAAPGYGLSVEFKYNYVTGGPQPTLSNHSLSIEEITTTSISTTTPTVVDYFSKSMYRTGKYVVNIVQGNAAMSAEILLTHNLTISTITEFGVLETSGTLASFSTAIVADQVQLIVTMVSSAAATISISRRML